MTKEIQKSSKTAIFKGKTIRKTIHNDEWRFVIKDIIIAFTDSVNPSEYLKKMHKRDPILSAGWGQIVTPLNINTAGGKQNLNFSNTKRVFFN